MEEKYLRLIPMVIGILLLLSLLFISTPFKPLLLPVIFVFIFFSLSMKAGKWWWWLINILIVVFSILVVLTIFVH